MCAAQTYPVQVSTFIVPPYSPYLADYTAPGSERLAVNLLFNDPVRFELPIRLKFTIEGSGITIATKSDYNPEPLYLQSGIPERLTGSDLVPYLDPQNLDFQGIDRRQVEKRGALPEGIYRICVEVFEINRNLRVSNAGCTMAWMILNDPPIINKPFNSEKVRIQDPQMLILQWTPRHTGSPNSAFSTSYDVEMVEIFPSGRNPNDAILTSPPIFTITTQSTILIYGPAETPLVPGREYALRVKARSTAGADELDLFKNNGYSQVIMFKYGDECLSPENIIFGSTNPGRIDATWGPLAEHTSFTVRYKEKSKTNAQWFEETTLIRDHSINGLRPNTEYLVQLVGYCGVVGNDNIQTYTVKTPKVSDTDFSCGNESALVAVDRNTVKPALKPLDIIESGDFKIALTEVTGANGVFSGKGVASIPWFKFATFHVEFKDIKVNKKNQVFEGNITSILKAGSEVIYEGGYMPPATPDNDGPQNDNNGNQNSAFQGKEVSVGIAIKEISVAPDGNIINIEGENDKSTSIERPKDPEDDTKHQAVRVTDSNRDTWIVDSNGNVAQGPTAPPEPVSSEEVNNLVVNFSQGTAHRYGFDKKDFNGPVYENARISNKDYFVAWKSVEQYQYDNILAEATGKSTFPKSVGFEMARSGVESSMRPGDSPRSRQVYIQGNTNNEIEEDLRAYVRVKGTDPNDVTEVEVGRLKVKTYSKITKHVVIVPVNDVSSPSGVDLRNELDRIYRQAVAEWSVTINAPFRIATDKLKGLADQESGLFSVFPQKCKDLNDAFKAEQGDNLDPDAYYIFLVKGTGNSSRSAFMPFKSHYGYVFVDNIGRNSQSLSTTIAHELGHGAFRLRHTFDADKFMAAKGSTANLMDYGSGTELKKYQWDLVHDPEFMIGLMHGDDESAMSKNFKQYVAEILNQYWCAINSEESSKKQFFKYYHFKNRVDKDNSYGADFDLAAGISVVTKQGSEIAEGISQFSVSFGENQRSVPRMDMYGMIYGYGTDYYIFFPGANDPDASEIRIYFNSEDNRKKFISNVINKPSNAPFYYKNTSSQLQSLIDGKDYERLLNVLLTLPDCVFKEITVSTRIALINELVGKLKITDAIEEVIVLKLLNDIPNDETFIRNFVSGLKTIDLLELFSSVDDAQGQSLSTVLFSLCEMYYKGNPPKIVGIWNYEKLSVFNLSKRFAAIQMDGLISVIEIISPDSPGYGAYQPGSTTNTIIPFSDPFSVITVNVSLSKEEGVTQTISTAMPLLLLAKIVNEKEKERAFNQAMVAVDVASFFIGIGELKLALKTPKLLAMIRRTMLGSADLIATATSIYCTEDKESTLCKDWEKFGVYVQLGLFSASAINQFGDLLVRSNDLITYLTKYSDYTNLGKITKKEFIQKLEELGLDKVSKENDAILAKLDEDLRTPEFKNKVIQNAELLNSWKVLNQAGETTLSVRVKDIEFVDDYLKRNPGKAGSVADDIRTMGWQKWVIEVSQVGLAKYPNVRKYLGNARTKQYLTNQELFDLEKTLKQAHPDVLKYIDGMDEFDFAEMARGYKDLKKYTDPKTGDNHLIAFENAVKRGEDFYGEHGWLSHWKLTPRIKESLTTIDDLKNTGKLLPTGNATDIQLASIHAYTVNGNFVNIPFRFQPTWFGEYHTRAVQHINEGLNELRKLPQRVFSGEVFSGKAFSREDFESKFVGGTNKIQPYKGYMSATRLESVAEAFIKLTAPNASGNEEKIAVIQRVVSKNGVYIDDLSDWGKNLGKTNHPDVDPRIQVQEEVLLNSEKLRQVSEPTPIQENGVHKMIDGMKAYYVEFVEL